MSRTVNKLDTLEYALEERPETDSLETPDNSLTISFINGELNEEAKDIWINTKVTTSQAFAQRYEEQEPELTNEERIPQEYHEYLDVFNETYATRFPKSRTWDHKIELKPDFEPKAFKSYKLSPEEQERQKEFIEENLKLGYIRPSKSPMASPFFFVSKKDGKLRPTQDYWYLNERTIKNAYPLPLISEIMDKVKTSGAKYFTKLDVRWGYNNIRIKEGDEWKAAFKTNTRLFEPTVMFFGLCNSPATFQAMMDSIFEDETHEGWIIVYIDDVLILSKDKKLLKERTKRVLQKLRDNDLYLKPKKCFFCKEKIEYLGMIIEEGKVSMDPAKLKGICDWPKPTTIKQTRSFLGFGNFYRRFIRRYSEIARPMNALLGKINGKDKPFAWTEDAQKAFESLKKRFTEEPVLIMVDQMRPLQIECDASKYASGAVLTQLDGNGEQHPAPLSRKPSRPPNETMKSMTESSSA